MEKIYFNVEKTFCGECSLALRRFIGHMEGIESVDVEDGKVAIEFDRAEITEAELKNNKRQQCAALANSLPYRAH